MSFKNFIYYCAICGGWAAFLAWGVTEMMGLYPYEKNVAAARVLIKQLDKDNDDYLSPAEAAKGTLPEDFASIDIIEKDNLLSEEELTNSFNRQGRRMRQAVIGAILGLLLAAIIGM